MKVSLIITTYNWKEALEVVLKSVLQQTRLPDEVIIADDGSREDTKELINHYRHNYPVPLIHSWQKDDGFRAARSRNLAISKATGSYIIIIDGDILLHPSFIEDHIKKAKPGWFIQAGRASLNKQVTDRIFSNYFLPSYTTAGIRNRKNTIHSSTLSKLFSRKWNSSKSTRSCNMSFWKSDLYAINGFNEEFIGWGREDSEIVERLLNYGLNRLYLKFSGLGFHLFHNENSRSNLSVNDTILQKTVDGNLIKCEFGLNLHHTEIE